MARPKIVTITRSVPRSGLTSSTLPEKFANGPVDDAHRIVLLERHLGTRPLGRRCLPVQNLIHFVGAQRHGRIAAAHEAGDARRVLHFVPQRVVHFHFHQHVARINQALAGDLLAVAQLHHFFGGNQDLPDLVRKPEGLGARLQRFRHLVFKSRIGVDDVPLLGRRLVVSGSRDVLGVRRLPLPIGRRGLRPVPRIPRIRLVVRTDTFSSSSITAYFEKKLNSLFTPACQILSMMAKYPANSEHRDNHHGRGAFHLLAVRPGDAPHLGFELVDIILGVLHPNS